MSSGNYVFVDGGHLKKYSDEATAKWFGQVVDLDFGLFEQDHFAEKYFYYDCLDDIARENENESELANRIVSQERFFRILGTLKGTHVRLGSLSGTAKKKRQKKVDILLAVDMLNHASRDNFETATLVTGDGDFEPLVQSVVDMGKFVELRGDKRHTSSDLITAADHYIPFVFSEYFRWSPPTFKSRFPLPVRNGGVYRPDPFEASLLDSGSMAENEWSLHRLGQGGMLYCDAFNGGSSIGIQDDDLERLRLFCELEYGGWIDE